eukprot:248026_1
MWSTQYSIYTAFLTIICIGVITVITCQLLADKHGKQKRSNDSRAKILLYGIYFSALGCSILGYTLHQSKHIPLFCKYYGFAPCFAMYASAKSCLFGFFLRRASKSNITNKSKWKRFFFQRIGPIYIFIYFTIYVSISAVIFRGTPTTKDENNIISYCLFDTWQWWFVIVANIVDLFNCIASLLLFLLPLIKSVKRLKTTTDNVNNILLYKFVRAMKWNVALSFIAALSSLMALLSIPLVQEYIWLFCTGDPLINSLCAFFMISTNRKFVKNKCRKSNGNDNEFGSTRNATQTTMEIATSTVITTDQRSGAYNMDQIVSKLSEHDITAVNVNTPPLSPDFGKSNPIFRDNNPYLENKLKLKKTASY